MVLLARRVVTLLDTLVPYWEFLPHDRQKIILRELDYNLCEIRLNVKQGMAGRAGGVGKGMLGGKQFWRVAKNNWGGGNNNSRVTTIFMGCGKNL